MTNALTLPGGMGLVSREDLAASLNNAAMSMPASGGGHPYLKMDKNNGDWLFGQEETIVEDGSLWAINPTTMMHGYVAWDRGAVGGAPKQEIMVPISRALPAINSLPELPMGTPVKGKSEPITYQAQRSVELTCISGEDEGTTVEYKQSSVGAMKLFAKVTDNLLAQLAKGNDIVAIVTLGHNSYKNKTYGGTTYNPEWPVQEWRPMDDTSAPGADEGDEQQNEPGASAKDDAPDADEEAKLAAEYEAEQTKAAGAAEGDAAPRRRMRR